MIKVLVVDDAMFMRASLKQLLGKNNIDDVEEAENGLEGVRKYKTFNPDIVLMDITMPEMSGIEALKQILSYDSKAKVIMVSALGQMQYVKDAILIGAKTFIVKPFTEEVLISAINKIALQ